MLFTGVLVDCCPVTPNRSLREFDGRRTRETVGTFGRLISPPEGGSFLAEKATLVVPLKGNGCSTVVRRGGLRGIHTHLNNFTSVATSRRHGMNGSLGRVCIVNGSMRRRPIDSLFISFMRRKGGFRCRFTFGPVFTRGGIIGFFGKLPVLRAGCQFNFVLSDRVLRMSSDHRHVDSARGAYSRLHLTCARLISRLGSLLIAGERGFSCVCRSLVSSHPRSGSRSRRGVHGTFCSIVHPFLGRCTCASRNACMPFRRMYRRRGRAGILLGSVNVASLR